MQTAETNVTRAAIEDATAPVVSVVPLHTPPIPHDPVRVISTAMARGDVVHAPRPTA